MAALDGLGFANYAIDMQRKGQDRFRADQERNALSQFMPKIYGSNQAQRAQMVPQIAQQSPEALNQLLPVIQKMDDAEMQRQKAETDGYYAAFWGIKDDADFQQRLMAAQNAGMPEELLPRSRGEAEFNVRKTLGLKQLLDAEFESRKLSQADRRMDLMERGQYGSPVTVMGPGGQPAFVQVNPQQGTARPIQMQPGYTPLPPQATQPSAPSGYRFAQDQTLQPIPGGPADPATKPPTESQSKDIVYLQRMKDANTLLSDPRMISGLQDETSGIARSVLPEGLANFVVSSDNQEAQVPAREWLAALLRKDTGAAITAQEFAMYGPMYVPKPGDSQATLQKKADARLRAEQAIQAGLGAMAIVAQERMTQQRSQRQPAAAGPPARPAPPPARQPPPNRAPAPARPPQGPMQLPPNPAQLRQGAVYQSPRGVVRYLGNGQFEAAQ